MGFLRKLAGLVVEFPADEAGSSSGQAGTGAGSGSDDVLASIEKARVELEDHVAQRKLGPPSGSGKPYPANDPLGRSALDTGINPFTDNPPPAAAPTSAGDAAGSQIPLPTLLTVDKIYERAGLSADPQQMNVYRVQQMLADPDMADLDISMRARTVKMTLKNMGHDLHEIIVDAAKRDQALDSYGDWLKTQVEHVAEQVETDNAKLKHDIEEFITAKNAQIAANGAALETARQSQQSYSKDRAVEEQRLFDTVAPFVAPGENPVVVGGSAGERKGDSK